jgi:hypothetical protein
MGAKYFHSEARIKAECINKQNTKKAILPKKDGRKGEAGRRNTKAHSLDVQSFDYLI